MGLHLVNDANVTDVCNYRQRLKRIGRARKQLCDLKHFSRFTAKSMTLSFVNCDLYQRELESLNLLADVIDWSVTDAVCGEPNFGLALWHLAVACSSLLARKDFSCGDFARMFRSHFLTTGLKRLGLLRDAAQFDGHPLLLELLGGAQLIESDSFSAQSQAELYPPFQNACEYGMDVPVATVQLRVINSAGPESGHPRVVLVINDAAGALFQTHPASLYRSFVESSILGLNFWLRLVSEVAVDHVLSNVVDRFPTSFLSRSNRVSSLDTQTLRMQQRDGRFRWVQLHAKVQYSDDGEVHTMQFVPIDDVPQAGGCTTM
eukprot:TRINITY_DN11518_c0_g1_i1.p1 TRINITY_DN11518_c0_g1~~TRINITY_DN11518_c0_g1_i1.p1  ORF type:complete len:318 (-),score=52.34 TRINITY_DN11518_c0_g1_i1:197-1150(-)